MNSNDCMIFAGAIDGKGYGLVCQWFSGRPRTIRAHRAMYEKYKGEIPDSLVLDHLCRVPTCINPDHLEAVTNRENILRGNGPTATNSRKSRCLHGHEFTDKNTLIVKGNRQCLACKRRSSLASYHRSRMVTI